jgi:hypothetical protein
VAWRFSGMGTDAGGADLVDALVHDLARHHRVQP